MIKQNIRKSCVIIHDNSLSIPVFQPGHVAAIESCRKRKWFGLGEKHNVSVMEVGITNFKERNVITRISLFSYR